MSGYDDARGFATPAVQIPDWGNDDGFRDFNALDGEDEDGYGYTYDAELALGNGGSANSLFHDDHDHDDHQPFDDHSELASEPPLPFESSSPVPWSSHSDEPSERFDLNNEDDHNDGRSSLGTVMTLSDLDLPGWGNDNVDDAEAVDESAHDSGSASGSAGGSASRSLASYAGLHNASSQGSAPSPWPFSSMPGGSSVSGPSSNVFVDSDALSALSPASAWASGSGDSRPASASSGAMAAPPHRHWRPQGLSQARVGVNHPPASPRRSSLTPTIHPNRRLPRPANSLEHDRPPPPPPPPHRPFFLNSSPGGDDDDNNNNNNNTTNFASAYHNDDDDLFADALPPHEFDDRLPRPRAVVRPPLSPQLRRSHPGLAASLDSDDQRASQAAGSRSNRLPPHSDRQPARASPGARAPPSGIPWDSDFDWGADMDVDDELIEVIVDRQREAPRQSSPAQEQRRLHRHHPHHQSRRQRQLARSRQPVQESGSSSANNNNNNNRNSHADVGEQDAAALDVIDLTEEPDSPVLLHHRPINIRRAAESEDARRQQNARNPRRQMSQAGRTPSLARSDGSILGQPHPVIDLTTNSDDELDIQPNRRLPASFPAPLPAPFPAARRENRRNVEILGLGRHYMPALAGLRNLSRFRDLFPGFGGTQRVHLNDAEVQVIGAHQFAMNENPLAGNQPEFNYQANGFGARAPTPKPGFEPPPPARLGFTRDTGLDKDSNDEMVIVCASCDNELKYSANDEDDGGPRPAKRPRTKKDREEHHFWAVKTCGHVYCKHCYSDRKKTKSKDYEKLGFQVDASQKTPKIFCAVDHCNSDVTSTQAWVGIFM